MPPSDTPRESELAKTIREWDRRTIQDCGLPGVALMENAGAAAARIIAGVHSLEPAAYPAPFVILCGPGNNGGDGYVVARHLDNAGLRVEVWLAFDRRRLSPDSDAGIHLAVIERCGLDVRTSAPPHTPPPELNLSRPASIVDALLGTGLSRPIGAPYASWVARATASGAPVFALDVPTGLDADDGSIQGSVLAASHTITFAAAKRGFYVGSGPGQTGKIHIVDIGIPRCIRQGANADRGKSERG